MRTTGKAMMVAAATMGIALAGCGSAGTTGSGASSAPSTAGSASTGTSAGSGTAASCLIGNWRSTGVSGTFDNNGVNGTLAGGAGVVVNIGADGNTTVDFDKMEPINFIFAVAGGNVKGTSTYGGTVNGTVKTSSEPTGVW